MKNREPLPSIVARARPFDDASGRPTRLLAFAELEIAGCFVIKGIRILRREEASDLEAFVVFPAEKGKSGTESADRWFDLAHPITAEARAAAITAVLKAYEAAKLAAQAAKPKRA